MRADWNGSGWKVTFAPSGGRLRRCAALKPVPILNLVSLAVPSTILLVSTKWYSPLSPPLLFPNCKRLRSGIAAFQAF